MKTKLALKFDSIQALTKKEQKSVNGGWGGNGFSCESGYRACISGSQWMPPPSQSGIPLGQSSPNHPCNGSNPYSPSSNCMNYCNSGGCCCA